MYSIHEWESDFKFDDQERFVDGQERFVEFFGSNSKLRNANDFGYLLTKALSRALWLSCLIVKLIQQQPLDNGFNGSKLLPTEIFGSAREVQINS